MKFSQLCFAAAVAAASLTAASAYAAAAAPAAIYELSPDPLTPGVVSTSPTITVGSGSTVDDFTFSLASDYDTSSTGLFFELANYGLEITSADLGLYAGTPTAPGAELSDTGVFSPETGSKTLGASLVSGNYFVQSTVTVPAGETGAFVVGATVSAAPEPSSWMLMILGVGAIGLALRQGRGRRSAGFSEAALA